MKPEEVEEFLNSVEPAPTPTELDRRILHEDKPAESQPETRPAKARWSAVVSLAASFLGVAIVLWAILRSSELPESGGNAAAWESRRLRLAEEAVPVRPTSVEIRWREIPWETDLAAALAAAGRENRPLLVWVSFKDPLDRACSTAAGLRASTLSDDEVIRRVSANLVPVALDHRRLPSGDDAAGRLVRILRADPAGCIGLWIASAEGKILARPLDGKLRTPNLLEAIDTVLRTTGPLTPRVTGAADLTPYRGKGIHPGGGVTLSLSMRLMHRGRADGPSVIDSLTVPAEEWSSLVPPRLVTGHEWTLPEAFARRFSTALVPITDEGWSPTKPEVRLAEMKAVVEAVTGGRALIRLEGRWEAERPAGGPQKPCRASTEAEGTVEVDLESRSVRSFFLGFKGLFDEFGPGAPRQTGAVLEWNR